MKGLVDREVAAFVVCDYVCFLEKRSSENVLGVVCGLAEREVILVTGLVSRIWDIWVTQLQVKCRVGKCYVHYLGRI